MKIVFLLALLANIFFFFWEYNSSSSSSYPNSASSSIKNVPKQIFLQSELTAHNGKNNFTVEENSNIRTLPKPIISESLESRIERQEYSNDQQETALSNLTILPAAENDRIIAENNGFKNEVNINSNINEQVRKKLVYCYKVGPFKDNDKLDEWSKVNKINKGSLQPFSNYSKNDMRYLVYYPASTDYETSKQNVQIFIDMGITDYWLFKSGDFKGAISLGLFDKAVDALALKENFFNRGVNVELRESYSNASEFFARVLSIDENFKETAIMSAEQRVVECE